MISYDIDSEINKYSNTILNTDSNTGKDYEKKFFI